MRAAIVLNAENAAFAQQAGEVNAILKNISTACAVIDLWLFYQNRAPKKIPQIEGPISGIRKIQVTQGYLPESYLHLLVQLMDNYPADLILFTADRLGEELATRLAYRLGGSSALQVESCQLNSGRLEITKPVYGNNLTGRLMMTRSPYCLAMAHVPSIPAQMVEEEPLQIEQVSLPQLTCDWVETVMTHQEQSETHLAESDFVLVAGQGAQDIETVNLVREIAAKMGAELGGSRQAVMNAWMDMNRLIGASGLTISPKLCIVAGVSGSAFFKMGIRNSELIVAINTDGDAPIFQVADVGIVADLKPVLLELEKLMVA